MAYFRHIEDAQKGCSLLRGTAGVKDDEGLLGQNADAAAVLHSGKARQNGLIRNLKALAPEGQRQLDRDGGMIDAESLYDSSDEKGTLRGSIAATLQKKMLVNTAGVLFELLGKTNDRTLITSAGSYLGGAFYQLYRALHRASGGKEGYFGLDATAYQSGAVDAQMRADYIAYASSLAQLSEKDGAFASMEDEALASLYPGLMQSVTQVLHSTEEKANSLLGRK